MKLIYFRVFAFAFFLFFGCDPARETELELSNNPKDYESLLLENKEDSLKSYLQEKSLLVLFPDRKVAISGTPIYLDFQINPNGSLSKPFPSSPCGIEVEGTWSLRGKTIVVDGFWIIPSNQCLVLFESGKQDRPVKKQIKGILGNFRKKNPTYDINAEFSGRSVDVMAGD